MVEWATSKYANKIHRVRPDGGETRCGHSLGDAWRVTARKPNGPECRRCDPDTRAYDPDEHDDGPERFVDKVWATDPEEVGG